MNRDEFTRVWALNCRFPVQEESVKDYLAAIESETAEQISSVVDYWASRNEGRGPLLWQFRETLMLRRSRKQTYPEGHLCGMCRGSGYIELVWAAWKHGAREKLVGKLSAPEPYPLCRHTVFPCRCTKGKAIMVRLCKRANDRDAPANWERLFQNCGFTIGAGAALVRECRALREAAGIEEPERTVAEPLPREPPPSTATPAADMTDQAIAEIMDF